MDTKRLPNSTGVTITPAFTNVALNGSYDLVITNNGKSPVKVRLDAALFTASKSEPQLILIKSTDVTQSELNKRVSFSQSELTLEAGKSETVKVTYKQQTSGFFSGALVTVNGDLITQLNGKDQQVGINGQLASVIVETKLQIGDIPKIITRLQVQPVLGIGDVNLGSEVNLMTEILNGTEDKILTPSGRILGVSNNGQLVIGQQTLTDKLDGKIYPLQSKEVNSTISDTRPFWQRIGNTQYLQEVQLNGEKFYTQRTVFNIPWEIALGVLVIVGIIVVGTLLSKVFNQRRK